MLTKHFRKGDFEFSIIYDQETTTKICIYRSINNIVYREGKTLTSSINNKLNKIVKLIELSFNSSKCKHYKN